MVNAIAFEAAHLLELPFTHTMIPVDVSVNGEYQGNYMLTEPKEVMKHCISIGEGGVLCEMDWHFHQPLCQFEDAAFELPIRSSVITTCGAKFPFLCTARQRSYLAN